MNFPHQQPDQCPGAVAECAQSDSSPAAISCNQPGGTYSCEVAENDGLRLWNRQLEQHSRDASVYVNEHGIRWSESGATYSDRIVESNEITVNETGDRRVVKRRETVQCGARTAIDNNAPKYLTTSESSTTCNACGDDMTNNVSTNGVNVPKQGAEYDKTTKKKIPLHKQSKAEKNKSLVPSEGGHGGTAATSSTMVSAPSPGMQSSGDAIAKVSAECRERHFFRGPILHWKTTVQEQEVKHEVLDRNTGAYVQSDDTLSRIVFGAEDGEDLFDRLSDAYSAKW